MDDCNPRDWSHTKFRRQWRKVHGSVEDRGTRSAFAREIRVAPSTVANWHDGRRNPHRRYWLPIAAFLSCGVADLTVEVK